MNHIIESHGFRPSSIQGIPCVPWLVFIYRLCLKFWVTNQYSFSNSHSNSTSTWYPARVICSSLAIVVRTYQLKCQRVWYWRHGMVDRYVHVINRHKIRKAPWFPQIIRPQSGEIFLVVRTRARFFHALFDICPSISYIRNTSRHSYCGLLHLNNHP